MLSVNKLENQWKYNAFAHSSVEEAQTLKIKNIRQFDLQHQLICKSLITIELSSWSFNSKRLKRLKLHVKTVRLKQQ